MMKSIAKPNCDIKGQILEVESTSSADQRRHDLDALRATAMLLGIVLHAALSFSPIPWSVSDKNQSEFFTILFAVIHGFRMPLFFLISGFFTAMLWRKRGLAGLLKQRAVRIVLPLILGCLTIVPAMWFVNGLATQSNTANTAESHREKDPFDAAARGDTKELEEAILSNNVSLNQLHPQSGASLLTIAVFCGQPDTVEMLLKNGADVNRKNRDSGTPLHVAVFMGRARSTKLLLQAGANSNSKDANGNTPKDNLKVDFGTTNFVAKMYNQTLDEDDLRVNRAEIALMLGEDKSEATDAVSADLGSGAIYGLLFEFPVFMHLWFLAFLCWLIVGFVGYTFLANLVPIQKLPTWLFCSPISLLWLTPLTMLPQSMMGQNFFGPDASIGLLPKPEVLAYYAVFFFFGAVYWDLDDRNQLLGRHWRLNLPLAVFVLFPIGFELASGPMGILSDEEWDWYRPVIGNAFQALFAWVTIFGLIGLFRDCFSRENRIMRYISDSSYWLYLAHLPVVIFTQWLVRDIPLPAAAKFVAITVTTTILLLVTYEYLIRYTVIGRMLNGPRFRTNAPM